MNFASDDGVISSDNPRLIPYRIVHEEVWELEVITDRNTRLWSENSDSGLFGLILVARVTHELVIPWPKGDID